VGRRKRHSKTVGRFRTKKQAWDAAQEFRAGLPQPKLSNALAVPTVVALVEQYRTEKMPTRYSTRRAYEMWLSNHILPKFGACAISDVQARPVELWLESLPLTGRSRGHIRGLLRILWDDAMWRGDVPTQGNPMELVTFKGSPKRTTKPHNLTVDEFQQLIRHLGEPFRTVALVGVCFGLRISEALALKWGDVDWLHGQLHVEHGMVRHRIGDVKTETSHKAITITETMIETLKRWKQQSQFSTQEDSIFASPAQIGRLPWSYDSVNKAYGKAALAANVAHVTTHSMRHTYRFWLDAVGTPIAVQQKLMRHADIRTTMNTYGDVVTDEMSSAASKVAGLAVNGTEPARKTS
jgi:integrase